MPRRGLSETQYVQIGSVLMTAAVGIVPAGDPAGRPLAGAFVTAARFDPNPGVTRTGATGRIVTIGYELQAPGHLWEIELRFTRFDPVAHLEALYTEFAPGTEIDPVVIPLSDGRTWTGAAKPDRRDGKIPVSETSGDHPHYGGQGRELVVLMLATHGGYA